MLTHSVSLVLSSKRQPAAASISKCGTSLAGKQICGVSGKLVRGAESFPSVDRSLSRSEKDRCATFSTGENSV